MNEEKDYKGNKKINKKLIIIPIIFLIVMAIGVTYAYFWESSSNNNVVAGSISEICGIEYYGGEKIEGELSYGNNYNEATASSVITITYDASSRNESKCVLGDYIGNLYLKTTTENCNNGSETVCMDLSDNALNYAVVQTIVNSDNSEEQVGEVRTGVVDGTPEQVILPNFNFSGNSNENIIYKFTVYFWLDPDKEVYTGDIDEIYEGYIFADLINASGANPALLTLMDLGLSGYIKNSTAVNFNTNETTNSGIFKKEDDLGITYYFRGPAENNYVKFGKYTEDVYAHYNGSSGTSTLNSTPCTDSDNYCAQIATANDDMYWRIVRINGDGTIRMIYDGTNAYSNGDRTHGSNRQIGRTKYNIYIATENGDNAHVGYMHGLTGVTKEVVTDESGEEIEKDVYRCLYYTDGGIVDDYETLFEIGKIDKNATIEEQKKQCENENHIFTTNAYEATHANIVSSYLKKYIDNWYKNYLKDDYSSFIADAIYCNERTLDNEHQTSGYGDTATLYNFIDRNYNNATSGSYLSFKCNNKNDRLTVSNDFSIETSSVLSYPIGTITADEIRMAGVRNNIPIKETNNKFYFYTGENYWTMTAYQLVGETQKAKARPDVAYFGIEGFVGYTSVNPSYSNVGVRPVISLNVGVINGGDGTINNPFVVNVSE